MPHGQWEVRLPRKEHEGRFAHGSRVKVHVVTEKGGRDRIPLYIRRAVQDERTKDFSGQVWLPPEPFRWTDGAFAPPLDEPLLIYEAHVGMAQEREGIGTYREFADAVLPRIRDAGYNTVQLMAVQEHPYYGSFGYHVSNFFAASSRFGTPEDLKGLVDAAHGMGLRVLLDLVHSHAVKNLAEGINEFDGTEWQFFHAGPKGDHPAWDSKVFDYGKLEVVHFLLSNVRFWLEEYHFDGLRFDGVTSMLYHHRGLGEDFDHYDKYFRAATDHDAVTYLQLASLLAREVRPRSWLVAEDMSGMPGLGRPVGEGGLGFDYRLGMGIPDYWIRLMKGVPDERWGMGEMWSTLTNRRASERTVAYAESHDQALVGDKTLAFWLMDADMYWSMRESDQSVRIDRGIALHKLIRLATLALGGEGWLSFMGNEFGHPEWVDFPREGNGWSYKYARRQWSLADRPDLRYRRLAAFDRAMVELARESRLLASGPARQLNVDESNHVLAFERGGLVFVLGFDPSRSLPHYRLGVPGGPGEWRVALDSDAPQFGGHGRVDDAVLVPSQGSPSHGQPRSVELYLPTRTGLVIRRARG
jgi:1,4-alpha-glucan branching enzyme